MSGGEATWVTVPMPGKTIRRRRSAGVGATAKSRAHKTTLIEYLRSPPDDFDGTNRMLSAIVGVSERQIIRLLKQLETDGRIKMTYVMNRVANTGLGQYCFTTRFIELQKEST